MYLIIHQHLHNNIVYGSFSKSLRRNFGLNHFCRIFSHRAIQDNELADMTNEKSTTNNRLQNKLETYKKWFSLW